MAFVHRIKKNDDADPVYEVIGLVTMEDVIEELIQEEINDETDIGGKLIIPELLTISHI